MAPRQDLVRPEYLPGHAVEGVDALGERRRLEPVQRRGDAVEVREHVSEELRHVARRREQSARRVLHPFVHVPVVLFPLGQDGDAVRWFEERASCHPQGL